ncbi:MAG: 4'-phosphopantetheinyl transferase superfamily protein [Polyangiaceae bacterium]
MTLSEFALALESEAHVWLFSLPPSTAWDGGRLDELTTWLSESERERASDFRMKEDRVQFIAAHACLRHVLSRYLPERGPQTWDYVIGPYGRPELAEPELRWLRFNLSHTGGLAACAVSRQLDCGVDVERRDKRRNFLGMSRTAFSELEQAELRQIPEERRQARFYEVWTLKEAYIKAIGMGLSQPLHQFSFALSAEGGAQFEPAPKRPAQPWAFYLDQPSELHQLALALGAAPAGGVRLFALDSAFQSGEARLLEKSFGSIAGT